MYEEKSAESEETEIYLETLIAETNRKELDEIARSLMLNPMDYPNKRSIAEAILEARERREAEMEEPSKVEEPAIEYPTEREETKEVLEVSPNTVKGKIKAMKKKAARARARAQKQMNENEKAAAAFNSGVHEQMNENEKAATAFNSGVHEQMNENEKAATAFNSGVQEQMKENEAAVAAFIPKVQEQMNENEEFVKQFYG